MPCEVRPGGLREAILHSVASNATHGVRRSNDDKRRAVLLLLADEEWAKWSDREIARRCSVSQPLVTRIRAEHLQQFADGPRTVSRGGKVYSMDTARIGRKPAEAPGEDTPDTADIRSEPAPSVPAAAPIRSADPDTTNVVQLGARLNVIPAPEQIERSLLAQEAAEELEGAEDFDATRPDHRALAINGALNTFDHVRLTGREYWKVYGEPTKRDTFIKWVMAAKRTIDDIVQAYEDQMRTAAIGRRPAEAPAELPQAPAQAPQADNVVSRAATLDAAVDELVKRFGVKAMRACLECLK
jgi:hypothetical protein